MLIKVQVFEDDHAHFRARVVAGSNRYFTNQDGIVMVELPDGTHEITVDAYDDRPPTKVTVNVPDQREVRIDL